MNAYSPIESMNRMEGAGLKQPQAAAIANEIHGATLEVVTKADLQEALDAQANKIMLRLGAFVTALAGLSVTISKLI